MVCTYEQPIKTSISFYLGDDTFMILEVAEIFITSGSEQAFIDAITEGIPLVIQTDGYISHELQQGMEDPTRFLLMIQWESLDAHNINFRQSDRFSDWRAIISPHFASQPNVQHFELKLSSSTD